MAAAPSLPPAPTLTAAKPACAKPASAAAPSRARVDCSFSGEDIATKAPVKAAAVRAVRTEPSAALAASPTTDADATGFESRAANAARRELGAGGSSEEVEA